MKNSKLRDALFFYFKIFLKYLFLILENYQTLHESDLGLGTFIILDHWITD